MRLNANKSYLAMHGCESCLTRFSARPHFQISASSKYQVIDFIEEIYYCSCLSHAGLHVNKFIFHEGFGTGNGQLNRNK